MFLFDLLFVLIIVLLITAVFGAGFSRHRGPTLLAFFIVLFMLTWAAGIWVTPFGYPVLGVYWLSFLTAGLLFGLLLLALIPPTRPRSARTDAATEPEEYAVFGTFFWILVVALILVIFAGYLFDPVPVAGTILPGG